MENTIVPFPDLRTYVTLEQLGNAVLPFGVVGRGDKGVMDMFFLALFDSAESVGSIS